jgi:hypothetical protein
MADFFNVSAFVRIVAVCFWVRCVPPSVCIASSQGTQCSFCCIVASSFASGRLDIVDTSCTCFCRDGVYGDICNANMTQSKLLSVSEISKHNSDADCWIVVDGQVWDITGFAPDHPGGPGSQSRASSLYPPTSASC